MRSLAPLSQRFAFEARRESSVVPRRRLEMSLGVLSLVYLVHRRTRALSFTRGAKGNWAGSKPIPNAAQG